jgi:hypothetical protein
MKKAKKNPLSIFSLCFILLLGWGCGYHFYGAKSNLPPEIQKVAIPLFANDTSEMGLERTLTNSLIYEFTRSKVLQVTLEKDSDAVLLGRIRTYDTGAVTFAAQDRSLERRITLTVNVSLKRQADGRVLWSQENLSRYETYRVLTDTASTEQNRLRALEKLAQDLSERIHNSIFESF